MPSPSEPVGTGERRSTARLPYLVLAAAMGLAGVIAYFAWRVGDIEARRQFETASDDLLSKIDTRIEVYAALLRGGAALFSAQQNELNLPTFRTYVRRLRVPEFYPGVQGVGFSIRLRRQEITALENRLSDEGQAPFRLYPEHQRPERHAIIYLEPLDRRNQAAIGYDMFNEPVRREAMERARDGAAPAASGRVTLVQEIDAQKQPGFLIYVPVYRGEKIPDSVDERRNLLAGFVYSPFRAHDLFRGIFSGERQSFVDFSIYDGAGREPAQLLYRSSPNGAEGAAHVPRFQSQRSLDIFGHQWTVVLASGSAFDAQVATSPPAMIVFAGGAAVSLLLFYLTLRESRARTKAEKTSLELAGSETALRESEARFRATIESAPTAMVMIDAAGAIMLVNAETEKLFGYAREELLGKPVEVLVPERFRSKHPEYRREFFSKPQARRMGAGRDLFGLRKDGTEFPIEIGLNPMETEEGLFVLSAIVDISERKRLEGSLRHANEVLERSNLELQQFASIAAHDLQAPLRTIGGFVQLLETHYKENLDAHAERWILLTVRGVERMHTLINDLLSYSRVDARARPFLPVDFAAAFEETLSLLETSIRDSAAEVTCGQLPTVIGDRAQMVQLLQNLIGNAIKYHGSEPPRVRVDAVRDGDEWLFSVRDNGIGIESKHHEKIFEIFQRLHTERAYPGTGIGLAVCRRVVHRHGGRLWVESQPGAGSVFYFTLPREQKTAV